jgi:hypothetical protein
MERRTNVLVREDTEKGDIAKSLEAMIKTHFVSKDFKDIVGSTRLTKREIMIMSLLELQKSVSRMIMLDEADIDEESLGKLSQNEQDEIKAFYFLKEKFKKNPHALTYALYHAWEYMYVLGHQSLDGGSRAEGTQMVAGTFQKILDPKEMGTLEKMKRRLVGDVLFTA